MLPIVSDVAKWSHALLSGLSCYLDVYRGQVTMALLNYLCRGKKGQIESSKYMGVRVPDN